MCGARGDVTLDSSPKEQVMYIIYQVRVINMRCKCCNRWFDTSSRVMQPFSKVDGSPVEEDMCRACVHSARHTDGSRVKFYQFEDCTSGLKEVYMEE